MGLNNGGEGGKFNGIANRFVAVENFIKSSVALAEDFEWVAILLPYELIFQHTLRGSHHRTHIPVGLLL